MTFILPIAAAIISIVLLLILAWISYPFILRFYINNSLDSSNINLQNGNNGANGQNGANAPTARNGSSGQAGLSTPAGKNGSDGRNGDPGLTGVPGIEGEIGDPGKDGEEGVSGIDPIFIRENFFDPSSKRVFYVNGIPINTHVKTVEEKKTSKFNKDVQNIKDKIGTLFRKSSNVSFFQNVASGLIQNTVASGTPNVLDTIDVFNTFLNDFKTIFETERANYITIRNTQNGIIESDTLSLNTLRNMRNSDLNKLKSQVYLDTLRNDKVNLLDLTGITETSLTDLINDPVSGLIGNPTITIDSKITQATLIRDIQQGIYDTSTNVAIKNAAKEIIDQSVILINRLKNVKTVISQAKVNDENLIHNAYLNSVDISSYPIDSSNNPYPSISFNDYSTSSSTTLKSNISTAREAIDIANISFENNLESFLTPYKNAN